MTERLLTVLAAVCIALGLAWLLLGCSGDHGTGTPGLGAIADTGHQVVQTASGQSCIPSGEPVPPGATVLCSRHCPPPPLPIPPRHHPTPEPPVFTPGHHPGPAGIPPQPASPRP